MNELKNRGVQDILLAAVDGLSVFPEAVNAVFPRTGVQLRVVRMARSVRFVPYKDRKAAVAGLKKIYPAPRLILPHTRRTGSPKSGTRNIR
ncbi:MAG: hypothetical protein Pg6C_20480 [Treponemataceae bacterium]|nr:MAG: hypothetical protein Pg6C_20480 [Treponemataceae bacterium]